MPRLSDLELEARPLTAAQMVQRWRDYEPVDGGEDGLRWEMDQYGEFRVAPRPTNLHQVLATLISQQLGAQLGGIAVTAPTVLTPLGILAPDVCWSAQIERFRDDPVLTAPEICVEVASPGNTRKWLLEKAEAYLRAGAREVCIVWLDRRICWYDQTGERQGSMHGVELMLPAGA